MTEILSEREAEEWWRWMVRVGAQESNSLRASYESLARRLAEVEAERDANATARDAWERLHGELSALTKRDLTLAADRVAAAEARLAEVEQALRDAIECVESWAAYASGYFQEKHDLAGDLARLRAVLDKEEPDRECGIHGPDATYVTQMESYCTCRNVDKGEPDG